MTGIQHPENAYIFEYLDLLHRKRETHIYECPQVVRKHYFESKSSQQSFVQDICFFQMKLKWSPLSNNNSLKDSNIFNLYSNSSTNKNEMSI